MTGNHKQNNCSYIDRSGKEFIDHYYYDSINGPSNKASEDIFAGESDLFLFENFDKKFMYKKNLCTKKINLEI